MSLAHDTEVRKDAGSDISDSGDNLQRQLLHPEAPGVGAGGGAAQGHPGQVHAAQEGHPRLLGRALRPPAHWEQTLPAPLARAPALQEILTDIKSG